MPYVSVDRFFGVGLETAWGQPATPNIWVPVLNGPEFSPHRRWGKDDLVRGDLVEQYDDIPLNRWDEFRFQGPVLCNSFPALMAGLLGPDTVTGSGPYTHTIGLATAQPSSYTGIDVDLINSQAKQFSGGRIESVRVSLSTAELTYRATYVGTPYTEVSEPVPTSSSELFVPDWTGSITIGGTVSGDIGGSTMAFYRNTKPIFTCGAGPGPFAIMAGACGIAGRMVIVVEPGDTTFTQALNYDHQSVVVEFTDPSTNHTVQFQMSAVQFKNPVVQNVDAWETIRVDFTAQANQTDATNGGSSPLKFIASNAVSTALG